MSKFESSSPVVSAAMFHKTTSGNVNESELINSGRDAIVQKSYNFNIAVFPDVMSFVQFAAQHFVSWTRSTDGKGHDPVDISDIIPPDPSSLPVSSIADMYTRSMLRRRVGYPLYEPDPFSHLSKEYLRNGVNVGDVGFIREDGAFDFLFNICLPQNNSINPPNLPDGFSLGSPGHSETRTMKSLPHGTRLFPPTVTRTISGEYLCEESEGAILELPEGAIQAEAINRGQFEALAKLHGVQWYKYTMTLGRSISNGSLYLVTSFTKCTQWGIGVFDRRCNPGQGLTFITSPLHWESSGGFSTKVADPNLGDTPNQCVFLRGYKIMIRQDIFDTLPRRQRAQRIRGGGGSDFVSRILTGRNPLTRTKMFSVKKLDEVVLQSNFNLSPLHPSDLINAALLIQNPDAKVALTHDDVWCDLLQDNFPKLNCTSLMNIAQSYRSIDEYGCISLRKISDSSNVFDESIHPVQGPEAPVLQESKADRDVKTALEPTNIHIQEFSPHKATSFHKAFTKIKNLILQPLHSHVLSRHPSERGKYQGYLPASDTTDKPSIDDKDKSVEIKNDLCEPLKPADQPSKHQVQDIHVAGRGVKRVTEYNIQSTAGMDKVKGQDGEYGNALQAASYNGASDIVQLLLDKGADVNAQSGIYGNALQAASYKGAKDVVELLLDTGADVNAQGGVYGNALQAASYNGAKDIVELLLDKGADVNAQSGIYGNALQAASYNGAKLIVEHLLDKGADVNAQGGEYGNALQTASYNGAKDIVELLLDKGADVNAQGGKYGNALQAASHKGTKDIVRLLLDKGVDVNARGGKYGSALQAASHKGAKDIVELLLDKGADVNARGGKYGNALQAASHKGAKDIVELLLDKGADMNARGGRYGSALQAASHKGTKNIVELLLDKGADVNARPDSSGRYGSALEAASKSYKGAKDILLPPVNAVTSPALSLSMLSELREDHDPHSPISLPPFPLPTSFASDESPPIASWADGDQFLRPISAPPGTVDGGDSAAKSWYIPPSGQTLVTERLADGAVSWQPEFIKREPKSAPLPSSPHWLLLLEQLISFIRESHIAQTATFQQQQDLARYMRELNEWLARDVNDRHDELNAVIVRLENLTNLTNALLRRLDEADYISVSDSEAEEESLSHDYTPVRPPPPLFTPVIPAPPLPMLDHHDETSPTNRLDILASLKNVISQRLNADEARESQQQPQVANTTEIPMLVPYQTPAATPLGPVVLLGTTGLGSTSASGQPSRKNV